MSALDAYSPCPCGSMNKYKWCCQKVESVALRAERLIHSDQMDTAQQVVEEGLKRNPDSLWLLLCEAMIADRRGEPEKALAAADRMLQIQPGHVGALSQRIQATMFARGAIEAAKELQKALDQCAADHRAGFRGVFGMLGVVLARSGEVPAALAHLEQGGAFDEQTDPLIESTYRTLRTDPTIGPWLKNPYELEAPPSGLSAELQATLSDAIRMVEEGRWLAAAERFEAAAKQGVPGANRNAGLCRLWVAADTAAVRALRRGLQQAAISDDSVDLEALCQLVDDPRGEDVVELVRLGYTIRDRDGLLARLRASKEAVFESIRPIEVGEAKGQEAEIFALLDRPMPEAREGLTPGDVPRIEAHVLVGAQQVWLELFDDQRFDRLRDRFTALAGSTIPPAHPKTMPIDRDSRSGLALRTEWSLPDGLPKEEINRLERTEGRRILEEVWPATKFPWLGGRTPREAAGDPKAEVPLRAALFVMEYARPLRGEEFDFAGLRASLQVPAEPIPDPSTVDVLTLHLSRLHLVPADRLDDAKLWALYQRARSYFLPRAIDAAARELVNRTEFLATRTPDERFAIFADLANLTWARGDHEGAKSWIEQGRQGEPDGQRALNAPRWDFLGLRLRARSEKPEDWVPELAVVLERYKDQESSQVVLTNLMEMGLVQAMPHPEKPDQVILDARPLASVMGRYGPRVTTATGELGVAAAKPEIWTPDKAAGGSSSGGGLWTPGSGNPPAGPAGGSKIIVPGR